ncbi:AimR family lysis-lysogeny pheromone receptor, partial [Bacillus paralicheniformis]|uniref:AimR family lysis-lysogeny pheromone receptor n=1 Tax=Bacillus paralicheniformis TaxID=1648923 RepID=UPI0020BDFF4E
LEVRRQKINTFSLLIKSPLYIRKALCYSHVSGDYEVIDVLIKKHINTDSVSQYLLIYDLFNRRNKNEIKGKKIVDEIKDLKLSSNA